MEIELRIKYSPNISTILYITTPNSEYCTTKALQSFIHVVSVFHVLITLNLSYLEHRIIRIKYIHILYTKMVFINTSGYIGNDIKLPFLQWIKLHIHCLSSHSYSSKHSTILISFKYVFLVDWLHIIVVHYDIIIVSGIIQFHAAFPQNEEKMFEEKQLERVI